VELQESLFWLCRNTALHLASLKGHTETAMALVKAGADVHCKNNNG
jgi:ankyrin repeat protein